MIQNVMKRINCVARIDQVEMGGKVVNVTKEGLGVVVNENKQKLKACSFSRDAMF